MLLLELPGMFESVCSFPLRITPQAFSQKPVRNLHLEWKTQSRCLQNLGYKLQWSKVVSVGELEVWISRCVVQTSLIKSTRKSR